MRASLFRGLVVLCVLTTLGSSLALGQWAVGVEIGADRFWGGTADTTGGDLSARPYRPTVFGLGLERRSAKLALGLYLHYTSAPLALEGSDGAVVLKGVFDVFSASPEIGYRLATVRGENELVLHGGPLIEVWKPLDTEERVLVGFQTNLSFRVPLGSRFSGTLLARGAVTASPFKQEEVSEPYEPRTLWRRGVAGRLEYRL
jgi:hypothetical protein